MLKACYRQLSNAEMLHATVKEATASFLIFDTPKGTYSLRKNDRNIRVSGALGYLEAPQPVELMVDEKSKKITSVTVKELPTVYTTLHQGAKEYQKQAADCFGNVPAILSVDLNAVAMNGNALASPDKPQSVPEMGTNLHKIISDLKQSNSKFGKLQLSTREMNKADNWGERILNAEADIVLMASKSDGYLSNTAIAQGVGQLLSNTGGAMYTVTKEGVLSEVAINSSGAFKEIAGVFEGVRLLVGEVTVPQTKVPYKLLQLQRDLDILGCHTLLAEEGADMVLEATRDGNTVVLIWFNGDRGELKGTMEGLAALVQHSDLPVTKKRLVVVYCPYVSLVATMATAAQLRSFREGVDGRFNKVEARLDSLEERFSKGVEELRREQRVMMLVLVALMLALEYYRV